MPLLEAVSICSDSLLAIPGAVEESDDVDPEAAKAAAEAAAKEKELAALEEEYVQAEAQFRIDLGLDTGEEEKDD